MSKLLSYIPWLEVLLRHTYWKVPFAHNIINHFNLYLAKSKLRKKSEIISGSKGELFSAIDNVGICEGDTIIVHSAFGELKRFGVTPDEVLDYLINAVGESGNIIMPAIPILKDQPESRNRFDLNNYVKTTFFDTSKCRVWTGILPQLLLKKTGSLRSRSPLNSMVVFGCNSSEIVRNDLFCSESLPCGKNSVLANALDFDAKILFLGVDEVHSLTMIHVAEDLFINDWPVKDWFWKREFKIKDSGFDKVTVIKERNPMWALFYAERRFSRDLLTDNILKREPLNNILISSCSANDLINYLRSKNKKGYPYCIPFWYRS
jgi:aminoglycoside N3'-acetyltransferase